jgi:hypothetical protein
MCADFFSKPYLNLTGLQDLSGLLGILGVSAVKDIRSSGVKRSTTNRQIHFSTLSLDLTCGNKVG